jgi:hypothetical protein
MRDKEYITKYLDNNYQLCLSSNFFYVDKETDKKLSETEVSQMLLLVFGNFVGIGQIFYDWSNHHKNRLTKGLMDYFNSMNLSLGSYGLLNELSLNADFIGEYDRNFITDEFNKFYISSKFNDFKIRELIDDKNFNINHHNSNNLLSLVLNNDNKETKDVLDNITLKLNEWYYDNVFSERLDEFFGGCRLVLGLTNWVVNHPTYGTFDEKSLLNIFSGETDFQKSILKRRYEEWYEEKIYGASEIAMKNLYF